MLPNPSDILANRTSDGRFARTSGAQALTVAVFPPYKGCRLATKKAKNLLSTEFAVSKRSSSQVDDKNGLYFVVKEI